MTELDKYMFEDEILRKNTDSDSVVFFYSTLNINYH